MAQQSCEQHRSLPSSGVPSRDPNARWARVVSAISLIAAGFGCTEPATPMATGSGTSTATAAGPGDRRCDPVVGDCPKAQRCTIALPSPACRATTPSDAKLAQTCHPGGCDDGLACVRTVATATVGRCMPVCRLDTGEGCTRWGEQWDCQSRIPTSDWGVCAPVPPACDPWSPSPCPAEFGCQPFLRRGGEWRFRCLRTGDRLSDEPCSGQACAPGLACVASTDGGTAVCRRLCRDNADCPSPEQCAGVVNEPRFLFCIR